MYLSQLDIFGFKSFPEKTTLRFNGGVTAVVGPNGCGKTNILDSIKWVLGEQRSSALRSAHMEDVIFNGTAQMKPLGLAEVNLTIKNNRGVLPLEYDEIVITRRLYRSGESEYLLNKSQCRLKDIMELFYDTGMGPHAYSVIQQGMVDAILSDKTEDRRSLFEEAAGVTKYKHRKKEAIGKLEATKADLLRLGDIISEIEKQVAALRRQAARARQYGKFKDQLKEIEIQIAASVLYQSQTRYAELENRRNGIQVELETINSQFDKNEMILHEARLKMTELERNAGSHRQRLTESTSRASEIESEIKLNKHRGETAQREIENSKTEIAALEARIANLKSSEADFSQRLEQVESDRQAARLENDSLENELAVKARDIVPAEKALEEKREHNAVIARSISALKAQAASLGDMKKNLEKKKTELELATEGIDKSRSRDEGGLNELEKKRLSLEQETEKIKQARQQNIEDIARYENVLNQKREYLSQLKAERSGLLARQELLDQLIESGEGYSIGAKSLMAWAERPYGLMTPIADILDVPENYRVAVAAAIGNMGEIIPAKSLDDAHRAIDYLKVNGRGRASFLLIDRLPNIESSRPANVPGLIGFLDDLVSYPDEYKPAISLILGRTALFDTRDSALAAPGEWRYFTRVDLDGSVIEPSGVYTGGKAAVGVIGRRQDLSQVKQQIEKLFGEIQHGEMELEANTRLLEKVRANSIELDKSERRCEEEKRRIDAQLGQLKFDFKERETKYSNAINQIQTLTGEIDSYGAKITEIELQLRGLESEYVAGTEALNELMSSFTVARNGVQTLESSLTASRIKSIELDGLLNKLKSDVEHGKELISEAGKMIASHQANIVKAQEIITTSASANEELETRLYDCFAERRDIQTQLHAVEDEITESMSQAGKMDTELSSRRKEKESLTTGLHALELEFVELESARKAVIERLKLEFNISSVAPAALPEGKTIEDIRQETDDMRSRLQRMDPVNLMAAEDYEREKDRLEFLVRQRDDLLKAETSLKEAITRINATAESRFNETFASILENFEQVFTTLFEGGEAHLQLEEPANPLESSIKITARPGGKRLLSVAQLSGGERALTAISLLFAIYLVKPSPFCILDEVDAPLDDANLMRFLKLIKRFSESTQFIVITHNKMTMEASDLLYGVTMESPGVSKVVSVKFANGNGNGNGNGSGETH